MFLALSGCIGCVNLVLDETQAESLRRVTMRWTQVAFLNTKINVANRIIAANDQMTENLEQVYNQVRSLRNAARNTTIQEKNHLPNLVAKSARKVN